MSDVVRNLLGSATPPAGPVWMSPDLEGYFATPSVGDRGSGAGIGEAGPHLEIPLFAGQVMLFSAEGFAIK